MMILDNKIFNTFSVISQNFFPRVRERKSCPTKLIPLTDNEELKIVLLSLLIYLLCHKHWEAADEGKDGRDEKCFSHFMKISR